MAVRSPAADWSFDPVLSLIQQLTNVDAEIKQVTGSIKSKVVTTDNTPRGDVDTVVINSGLGDFSSLWDYLGVPNLSIGGKSEEAGLFKHDNEFDAYYDSGQLAKGVRWRDELIGADLEDNVEPIPLPAASLRTLKRAQRRGRAKERAKTLTDTTDATIETTTDAESDAELDAVRRSPDRRALVARLMGRPLPQESASPPTSPSPPKVEARTPLKDFPISNPSFWSIAGITPPHQKLRISAQDGLNAEARKAELIRRLSRSFPDERKYLSNQGLMSPEFNLLNTSDIGVHMFVDMSNISIGFHDCLKAKRNIPIADRVRRIPMNFHNFSLVLERGRPASKRVLAGSDRTAAISEAESIGYEVNILERVHKAKQLTPKQKKYLSRSHGNGNGNTSASGLGETSGSETNQGYSSSSHRPSNLFQPSKWVEQGVDEILHLKMLESVIDAKKPATIVLATGDAAEAEYSAGFLRMVERALEKGWVVELVSFEMNTSSAYKKPAFRNKWGPMFRWVRLDDFAEYLIKDEVQLGPGE